jgi:hypothetical protein
MDRFLGIKVAVSTYVPPEIPVITFDPLRKCAWASEQYRAQVNGWLLKRFGTQQVAFMFDSRKVLGQSGFDGLAIHPDHIVRILNGLDS